MEPGIAPGVSLEGSKDACLFFGDVTAQGAEREGKGHRECKFSPACRSDAPA
jgi:hypothetical protein